MTSVGYVVSSHVPAPLLLVGAWFERAQPTRSPGTLSPCSIEPEGSVPTFLSLSPGAFGLLYEGVGWR